MSLNETIQEIHLTTIINCNCIFYLTKKSNQPEDGS